MAFHVSNPIRSSELVERAWHALYTRHQHEKTVAHILANKGFEVFLPLYAVTRMWKDRTKVLFSPLFPCYVFLKGGLERRMDIMKTPGLHAFVSCGGQPAAIRSAEIDAIQRVVQSGSHVEPYPLLKSGDSVRVKSGPLEGIQGTLVRKKNVYRLVLSVEILGRAAAVEVDTFLVERVSARPRNGIGFDAPAVSVLPISAARN